MTLNVDGSISAAAAPHSYDRLVSNGPDAFWPDHLKQFDQLLHVHGLDVVVVEPSFLLALAVSFAGGEAGQRTHDLWEP
jgi:hypothetical protein